MTSTRGETRAAASDAVAAGLRPYVADLHADWLRERPDEKYRSIKGTLVFADVSGFTPLTERLAKRGRIGAESLTDVLNEVFDTLLTEAARHGGDLLKFGGDALLLLFRNDRHERRAVAAAAAMQQALRRWRRFTTEAGLMSLRMSVGIASGDIHAFLVGSSHRELLIGGPVVSRVVALESAADATEILLGETVAAALDEKHLGAVKEPGRLLRKPPEDGPVLPRQRDRADVTAGIPLALRDHLSRRVDEGEHRQAVLTFVQFKGLDNLLRTEGPQAATAALDDLVHRLQQSCEQHGVCFLATDLDGDGGKILLVAGAPVASTDDVDRTLVTLLDVVAEPSKLSVRAGVNAGPAFAVDVGSASRRTYAVMGDNTNLAARVMGKAQPGQVVATKAALDRARSEFEHEPLEPFMVKGKSRPVTASVVRRPRLEASEAASTRLVGRLEERRLLDALVDGARAGQGGALTLVGEAGIGKSALVGYLRTIVEDLPSMTFQAAPYATASPYFAVRGPLRRLLGMPDGGAGGEALQRMLALHAPQQSPWAPLIGVVLGVEIEDTDETRAIAPEFRRARAHDAVRRMLVTVLPGPAAILVEDAHWLDEASAALLGEVAGEAAEHRWAVLVTRRPSGQSMTIPGGREVPLAPLASADVEELAATALDEVPAHVRARLAARSGGNPLFLLELLAAAKRGEDEESLPETLESLVASRVDSLDVSDRTLVRHASVFGHRFTAPLLAELTGRDESRVDATLHRLAAFVVPEESGYRFVHALLRDAAYTALPYRQRRTLHGKAGSIIERRAGAGADDWSDLLSLHFAEAQQHEKAWRYGKTAAARARVQWAPAEACMLYQRALSAAGHLRISGDEVGEVYEELGDCAELAGRYGEAADAYREARKRWKQDLERTANLLRKEGWVRERSGRYSAALRWYGRGFRTLERHPDAALTRAQLALAAGAARLRQGRYHAALPLLKQAVEGATQYGDEATLAHAYYLLDWAYTDLGSEEALRYRELSLPIYERLGNLGRQGVVCSNLGIDAYFEGRWDEAVALYEKGRDASNRAGDVVQAATAANNIGEVWSDQGRLEDAEAMFRDALTTWRAAPFPVGIWLATSNLGRAAARGGRFVEAHELFEQARRGFAEIGADGYVVETQSRDVERCVLAGAADAAARLADEALQNVEKIGGLPHLGIMLRRLQGYAAAQHGDADRARQVLHDALHRAEQSDFIFERALTLEALGRVLDAHEAEPYRIAAAGLLQRLGVVSTPSIPLHAPRAYVINQRNPHGGEDMRIESSVRSISWIPSEAISGMTKMPFEIGVAHYDEPPPEVVADDDALESLRRDDRFRFANVLSGWIEVDDGRIVDYGVGGGGRIGVTKMKLGKTMTFEAMAMPDLQAEPEVTATSVTFRRTAGGSTGAPAPRRVAHPPYVQFRAPLAWTTLKLTLHADGRIESGLDGASPFPRHWVYGEEGGLLQKSGLIDFKEWYRTAFGKHTPWGDEDSPAFVAEVESALERELSRSIMTNTSPDIRRIKQDSVLIQQGAADTDLYLLLDGILTVAVDGNPVAELGPGALLGERAILEGGRRTSTVTAATACKVAVVDASAVDRDKLIELREGHRREEQQRV